MLIIKCMMALTPFWILLLRALVIPPLALSPLLLLLLLLHVLIMVELFAKNQNRHKLRALELFTMAMCQNKDKPKALKLLVMEEVTCVECLTMFFCSSPWQTQPNPTSTFPSPSFMHCCMKIT